LYLQEYSITFHDPKQEKNNTKPNYFNKLTQSTFYEIIKLGKKNILLDSVFPLE